MKNIGDTTIYAKFRYVFAVNSQLYEWQDCTQGDELEEIKIETSYYH